MTVFSSSPQELSPAVSFGGDLSLDEVEQQRRRRIQVNRLYYNGDQFDAANQQRRAELTALKGGEKYRDPDVPLPEHERLHVYSTQLAEAVQFIAGQLTDGMGLVAESGKDPEPAPEEPEVDDFGKRVPPKLHIDEGDEELQQVIDTAVDATDRLRNDSDEDISFDELMIDAAQAGDVVYETRWDPVEQTAYWEFWPSEQVEFKVPSGSHVEEVSRTSRIVIEKIGPNQQPVQTAVTERVIYDLVLRVAPTPDGGPVALGDLPVEDVGADLEMPHRECRRRVFHEGQDEPVELDWLGLPFIPWGLLRINRKGLNGYRGEPLMTKAALANADRYNANEQTAFLIARFNSHGVLCVVGDQAFLKLQQENYLAMDIADVLSFPGGTNAFPIQLPTDPQMIEHTRHVTEDAMLAEFGLTRTDPETLGGLGGVTGYALEILNRKSEGTFKRIRRTWKADVLAMVNQMLDVTAYRRGAVLDEALTTLFEERPDLDVPSGLLPEVPFWEVKPEEVFPNRKITVRMGSGYIVDDVQIRDDFTAKLISQQEALRQRGYAPDEIEKIMAELSASREQTLEGTLLASGLKPDGTPIAPPEPVVAQAGQTVQAAGQMARGVAIPNGTQAGATTGSTRRQ